MELRQLRYALAVAEEMHFTRAAQRLRVAQPSLSRQIRELEAELGARLFLRTSRRVELTAAGRAFVASARQTIQAADAIRAATLAAAKGAEGLVTLGFVSTAAIQVLPEMIRLQRRQLPGLQLTLREMRSEAQLEALHAQRIDIGLTRDLTAEPRLTLVPLFRECLRVAVHESHPLAGASKVRLTELVTGAFVSLPAPLAPRASQLLNIAAYEAHCRVQLTQEANQYATLLALVAAEVGAAVVPESVQTLRTDGVRYLELADAGAWSEIQATMLSESPNPAAHTLMGLLEGSAALH